MIHDWKELLRKAKIAMGSLGKGNAELMQGYAAIARSPESKNVLGPKTRQLVALAVAATTRCDTCIAVHAAEAVKQGATREELLETLAVAVELNAGAALVYSSRILDAYDQFTAPAEPLDDRSTGG